MMKKLLCSFIFVMPMVLWGQNHEAINTHRTVVVTQGDSLIEASIMQKKPANMDIKPELQYYWYENYLIHTNQGGFSGWLLDGDYCIYTLDGHSLIGSGKFVAGLKEGEWKNWDKNGKLIERITWEKGRLDGDRFLYCNGMVYIHEQYKNGLLHGKTIIVNADGSIIEKDYLRGVEKIKKAKSTVSKENNKEARVKEKKPRKNSLLKKVITGKGKKGTLKDTDMTSPKAKLQD
jgi:antitoxin component YwqK of YwqJK toxin-antitoxin module